MLRGFVRSCYWLLRGWNWAPAQQEEACLYPLCFLYVSLQRLWQRGETRTGSLEDDVASDVDLHFSILCPLQKTGCASYLPTLSSWDRIDWNSWLLSSVKTKTTSHFGAIAGGKAHTQTHLGLNKCYTFSLDVMHHSLILIIKKTLFLRHFYYSSNTFITI